MKPTTITLAGIELELFDSAGAGPTLLFLHGMQGFSPDVSFVGKLTEHRRLIAPSHPGFGRSSLPDWLDQVDDIAYLYLELMDRLDLARVDLLGHSLGGWIAAEMATKAPERFGKLVLVAPVGVKLGPADRLDIPDVFAMSQEELDRRLYHDPAGARTDPAAMSDDALTKLMRNRETLALLAWEPYLHNPKLPHRLHRITQPTLFLHGESDGLVSPDYIEGYASLFPDARVRTIPAAGHAPQMEQPEAFVALVTEFLHR